MENELLYLSGNDIPFEKARLIIHQPTVKEIAYIGEKNFFTGCQFLIFSKEKNLQDKDKILLEDSNDFKILMTMIRQDNVMAKNYKICMSMVLALIFPQYKIDFLPLSIRLLKDKESFFIDENNFDNFKEIIQNMFCLGTGKTSSGYNPGGPQAAALVKKFEERARKLAKLKGQANDQVNILSQYISILTVGQQKNINQLLQYTVYQLQNEMRRFRMKTNYDMHFQARMAGAQNLQEVKNWMGKISTD